MMLAISRINGLVLDREFCPKIEAFVPKQDLKGQSVAIIGLGKSGIAAAKLALARGASVLALDQNETLKPLEKTLLNANGGHLKTILGCFDHELFDKADLIVVSPGVPLEHYCLASLLQSGKRVISELDFAAEVLPRCTKVLAVTGTNGKSTVATFAGQMLSHLNIRTFVGGNLGIPLSEAAFECLSSPQKHFQARRNLADFICINCRMLQFVGVYSTCNNILNIFTLKLDPSKVGTFNIGLICIFLGCCSGSKQLSARNSEQVLLPFSKKDSCGVSDFHSYCTSAEFSHTSNFQVSVILNLTPDHLERHKSMTNYSMIKCRVFSHMSGRKMAILPMGNPYITDAIACHANECMFAWIGAYPGIEVDMEQKVANFNVPGIGFLSQLPLDALQAVGTHNYYNAAIAALSVIGLDVGIDIAAISSTIDKLKAPPHRMQIVHEDRHGVTWVDDSKATNVEATYAGLMGLREKKAVVLLGGLSKILDAQGSNGFEQLIEPLKYHRGVVTFGSSGALIKHTLSSHGLSIPCLGAKDLKEAVSLAKNMAKPGDAILLSPACASFDEFRNFEHRGKFFQELALGI